MNNIYSYNRLKRMRWTNPSRPAFSQSQQFSKNQLNRNPRPSQFKETDLSTQKNLIYDLRSELSNLKNQFTRLINKPGESDGKQRRETFEFSSQTLESATPPSFHQRQSFHEKQKTASHLENISNTQKRYSENEFTPLGKGHNRSSSFASTDKNTSQSIQISNHNNDLISENNIHKIGPFKQSAQKDRSQERQNISNRYSFNDQSFQKQKQRQYLKIKFQQNNYTPSHRVSENYTFATNQFQVDSKKTDLERQLKQKQQQNQEARQKIQALTDEIGQISATKAKQLESMRQVLAKAKQELRAEIQQEKSKLSDKYEYQRAKNESIVQTIREEKKELQKQMLDLKEKHEIQLEAERKKLKDEYSERLKLDQRKHDQEIEKLHEKLYKKNQFIKDLLSQREMQRQKIVVTQEKPSQNPIKNQCGVNTEESFEEKTEFVEIRKSQEYLEEKNILVAKLEEKQKQLKTLQDKVRLYLNNIDKQSVKLKQYKTQIQLSENFATQSEFIIKEKENVIHNLLNQLKSAEKEIQDQRMTRKALECLLQQSNEELIIHKMRSMDRRYSFEE